VLSLVDGLINSGSQARQPGVVVDVTTFKEPYRLEGRRRWPELAEIPELPDVIVIPPAEGPAWWAWKALRSCRRSDGPARCASMVSVQAEGCAPIVRAFHNGAMRAEAWPEARTVAAGLRVPLPFADRLILRILRESEGTAVAVSDAEILDAQREMAGREGIFAAPEGAATLAALRHLLDQGWVQPNETVVLFNTGSGLKYVP
jgi:threonine synthase